MTITIRIVGGEKKRKKGKLERTNRARDDRCLEKTRCHTRASNSDLLRVGGAYHTGAGAGQDRTGQSNSWEARRSSSSQELWDLHRAAALCGGRASAILTMLPTLWLHCKQKIVRIGVLVVVNCLIRVTFDTWPSGSSCRLKPVAIKVMLTCMDRTT